MQVFTFPVASLQPFSFACFCRISIGDVLLKAAQQLSGLALFASRKSREQLTSACLAATFIGVSAPKETAGIMEELDVLSLVYTVNC